MELLRDCLLALPSLHTLEIVGTNRTGTGAARSVFNHGTDFPNIRKVTIPTLVYPILSRLPKVEELVFIHDPSGRTSIKTLLSSLRGPYVKERRGEVEPVLKSFTIIRIYPDQEFAKGMYTNPPPPPCRLDLADSSVCSRSHCRENPKDTQGLSI